MLIQILYSTRCKYLTKIKGFYILLREQGLINIELSHFLALNHFQNKCLFAIDSEPLIGSSRYNLITIQEQLFESKFEKHENFAHFTSFGFFSKL